MNRDAHQPVLYFDQERETALGRSSFLRFLDPVPANFKREAHSMELVLLVIATIVGTLVARQIIPLISDTPTADCNAQKMINFTLKK